MERSSAIITKGKSLKEGPRTYIVYGVMRGGTSMVGGVLRGMGLHLGPDVDSQNQESAAFAGKPIPEMRKTIEEQNELHEIWGWKFPQAANYVDRLWGTIRKPHLICVYRDAVSNARGLNRWHPVGELQAIHESLLAQQKNLALSLMRGCPSLLISYEKAARNKEQFVEELADWTGLEANYEKFDFDGFMSEQSYKSFEDYCKEGFGPENSSDANSAA
ncbi:hypothetical protein BXY66_3542 [Shimia isoporae]|uniref:Sulfotransferase family protein n=1 Tax=Shimia isoporae TaxID=647720 RepID=A0A4R1N159_9RHOB|nr:hypothetical protein [Shimia isoporae]TCK99838.1 hypothetical protein BXY66_3542 [Shimia isoporae]